MKRIWSALLILLSIPADIAFWVKVVPLHVKDALEVLGGVSLWHAFVYAHFIAAVATIGWWVWVWKGLPTPIIFGGYRLRRLTPLVLDVLRIKELASSQGMSVGITHFSLASELSTKLDQLRIEHPDLHTTFRAGDTVDDKYTSYSLVLVYLEVLRRHCMTGDLRGARAIMSRVNTK